MQVLKKAIPVVVAVVLLSFLGGSVCHANSAEPPSVLIIVPNAPQDLEIRIGSDQVLARRMDSRNESYFVYYARDLKFGDYAVTVTTGGVQFQTALRATLKQYNNVYTLDLGRRTLTPGKSLARSATLLSLRIGLTILIEGAVFFLFGYRKRRSWTIFLVTNLVSQGLLYVSLSQASPLNGYLIFDLIGGEVLVFMVEMIVFLALVDEHSRLRTAPYVLLANLLSLIAGGYLITVLPI
jgi:hypothetical protein